MCYYCYYCCCRYCGVLRSLRCLLLLTSPNYYYYYYYYYYVVAWRSGNAFCSINEVTLCRAGLVL